MTEQEIINRLKCTRLYANHIINYANKNGFSDDWIEGLINDYENKPKNKSKNKKRRLKV